MSKKKDSFKPWLRRPAVNRSVTIPVTGPLTQPLTGFGGTFDPLSLNPYAYFDGESYKGTLENPTLDLDPSNPDSLDVITATRSGTTATYTDSSGLIQVASADSVRVDYTQGAELTPTVFQRVGYTDFSQGWGAFGGFTSQSADDFEGESAIRLVSDGTSSNYYQVEIQNTEEQQQYVFSFYCRRVSGSGDIAARHALSVTGSSTSITVTSNWQRVSVTCLGRTGGGGSIFVGLIQSTGDGVYEFSQPQVEEGTTASSFVANTTGSPKFIASATYGPRVPMILVEPSATNLIENTDFSGWVQASNTTLQDGLGYAGQPSKIFTASAGTHRTFRSNTFASNSGTTYTGSLWIRRVTGTGTVQINHQYSAQGNLTNITSDINEDWTRIEINFTGNANSGDIYFGIWLNVQGDAVEIALPQVEAGSVATSYIPTSGSTVTRAADDLVISGSAFDFYNQSEGTIYAESITNSEYSARYILQASSSVGNPYENRFTLSYKQNGNLQQIRTLHKKDNVTQFDSTTVGTFTVGTLTRAALSYKTGDYRFSANGEAELTPSGLKVPSPSINQIHLGATHTGSLNLNGHIKRVIYWPYHSDNL